MTPQNNTHAGPISGWTWSSGLPHVRAFGLDGEMQRIESAVATTYAYDAGGRMTGQHLWSQLLPAQDDTQNQYTLDLAGRLTASSSTVSPAAPAAASTLALAYAYDANGNRLGLSRNGIQGSYAYSANRLTAQSGGYSQNYQYDGAGRMTADGLHTYTYNGLGRLATVSGGSGTLASYRYNAFGQRVAKDSAGGNVRFVYDEAGHLLGEYTDNGALIQELVWLEDLPVATLRPKTGGGTAVYYIHPDHLGTPRQITDSTNQIVWRWDSPDPFGYALPDENPGSGGVFEFNLRFPGQYYDKETGRHYNYFRDYDPATGRYTTSDPIGLGGGANRYTYVGGNPLTRTDPFGLFEMCHRDLLVPIPYARHCYMKFGDGSTSSYDPNGVAPDPDPNQEGTACTKPQKPEKDNCIKKKMKQCEGKNYHPTKFNCCHCVEQAMKECGVSIPAPQWPNWPVNPGPQPGEPGYTTNPIYNNGLGK